MDLRQFLHSVCRILTSSPCEKPPLTVPRCGEASTEVSTVDASGGEELSLPAAFFGPSNLVDPNIMRIAGRKRRPWNSPKNTVIENICGEGEGISGGVQKFSDPLRTK